MRRYGRGYRGVRFDTSKELLYDMKNFLNETAAISDFENALWKIKKRLNGFGVEQDRETANLKNVVDEYTPVGLAMQKFLKKFYSAYNDWKRTRN